jgi:hypothetical protein
VNAQRHNVGHGKVQVYSALASAEGSLDAAAQEIFVGRICGSPFYIPRFFTAACCLGSCRHFPRNEMQKVCSAIRGVTRVQLSLNNLLEDGVNETMVSVIAQRFPPDLVPHLVASAADVLLVCCLCHVFTSSLTFSLLAGMACIGTVLLSSPALIQDKGLALIFNSVSHASICLQHRLSSAGLH